MSNLPEVAGDRLTCSLAEFEHRCRVYLDREQRKIDCDTGLVALICDAVRLSREHTTLWRSSLEAPQPEEKRDA